MDHSVERLLDRQKDSIVLGTYETSAFILSLRSQDEFTDIHSFGYHRIPHIGVYGRDYSLSLPMVLLSLPATTGCIQRLPSDLVASLDLDNCLPLRQDTDINNLTTLPPSGTIVTSQHNPPAAHITSLLREHSCSTCCTVSIERIIAKAIVEFALKAACRRILSQGDCLWDQQCEALPVRSRREGVTVMSMNSLDAPMDWRLPNRGSSAMSVESEGYVSASSAVTSLAVNESTAKGKQKRVSFHIEEDMMPVDTLFGAGVSLSNTTYCEEEIRIAAKKLVMKVLHMACHKLESLYRRSSIEYLIASTKRMRIDESPPPPPTLYESEEQEDNFPNLLASRARWSTERGSTLESLRKLGKKRERSGSHDVTHLKELRKMKQGKKLKSRRCAVNNSSGTDPPRRILSVSRTNPQRSVPTESSLATMNSVSSLLDAQRMSSLVSDVKRMSISTCSESAESDTTIDTEETYTILNAVTIGSVEEEESQTVGSYTRIGEEYHASHEGSCLSGVNQQRGLDGSCLGTNTCCHLSNAQPSGLHSSYFSGESDSVTNWNTISDMDLFFIIHSHPTPGLCQKFLCDNTDEVNMLYHCWLFPDVPFSPATTVSRKLEMGVFEPAGVQPVHLDLQDAGITFGFMDERTVCIHSCCFSPENAQLQLQPHPTGLHMFYSAAKYGERRVVALHVLPANEGVEHTVRECIQTCSTLGQLCESLVRNFPPVGQKVLDLVLSLSGEVVQL